MRALWFALGVLVLAQIGYPLTHGTARAGLVLATVTLGFLISVTHAAITRGVRTATILVVVAAGGGLAVEALGVATGFPFGRYDYGDALGPKLAGVPLVIPLAWAWMAWPAWLVSGRLGTLNGPARGRLNGPARARRVAVRVVVAGWALATWDLFLDPQMVAEGYWTWRRPHPTLPGIPDIPAGNFAGWLAVAVTMMAVLAATVRVTGPAVPARRDAPVYALYLWTYVSSVVAGLVFLDLPGAAAWIGTGMGLVAVPLAVRLATAPRGGRSSRTQPSAATDPNAATDPAATTDPAAATDPAAGTGRPAAPARHR